MLTGILKVFFTASLWSVTFRESQAIDCSTEAVTSRLSKCVKLELNTIGESGAFEKMMSSLCSSVECSIACYEDALRGCTSAGMFRIVDFKANRVSMRYTCQYPQELLGAVKNCGAYLITWSCFNNFVNEMMNATKELPSSPDGYVTSYCRASKSYKTCSASSTFGANGTCTAQQASVINTIYDISLSSEACGISQDNPHFDTYGGPPEDAACGAVIVRPLHVTLALALSVIISFM